MGSIKGCNISLMAKVNVKAITAYVISALLLVFYLFTLYDATKYNVSDEYRMFYLTRELRHYVEDGGLKEYTDNVLFEYKKDGNCKNRGLGFSDLEDECIWIVGNNAVFYIYLDEIKESYELEIKTRSSIGYNNKLYINDEYISDIYIDEDGMVYINVPGNVLKQGINAFSIRTEDAVFPYNLVNPEMDEPRELNLSISTIILR